MTDDILDAAQKAINDAAKSAGLPTDSQPPQPPSPPPAPEMVPAENPAIPPATNTESIEKYPAEQKNPESVIVPPVPSQQHHSVNNKKPSKGPLIALIALLLLILPVSVYFISQQNQQLADIRSKAAWDTVYQGCTVNPDSCGEGFTCHCQNGNACTYTLCEPDSQTKDSCERQGRAWCINGYNGNAYTCCYPGYQCGANNTGCYETGGDDDNGDDDDTTATPTPTTGNAPVCLNIKLYKDGTQVADLTTLRPGDAVVLAVRGNLNPTKAHFRVNGGAWNETTAKNANDEFTWGYTIADGITDFVIEGEVFTNGAWH